jgi:excisionase family DNA binding protein
MNRSVGVFGGFFIYNLPQLCRHCGENIFEESVAMNSVIQDSPGGVLTRIEAANYLRISKSTLDKLDIPKSKLRRRVLYRKTALDQWLVKREAVRQGGSL